MNKPYSPSFLLIYLLLLPLTLSAEQDWPLKDVVMKSSFVPSYAGVYLSSDAEEVHALDGGKIIYVNKSEDFSPLPNPLGEYVFLEHKDQFFTLYAGIEGDVQDVGQASPQFFEGAPQLGRIADSSAALYFAVFDGKQNQWVNPQILLPQVQAEPDINIEYIHRTENGIELAFAADSDFIAAPYLLHVYQDDTLIFNLNFNTTSYFLDTFSIVRPHPFVLQIPIANDGGKIRVRAWTYNGWSVSQTLPAP